MATLKIWVAKQNEDSACYNIIGKTKKEVLNQVEKNSHVRYDTIGRYEINYRDAFDLFGWVTGEAGGRDGSYTLINKIQELIIYSPNNQD